MAPGCCGAPGRLGLLACVMGTPCTYTVDCGGVPPPLSKAERAAIWAVTEDHVTVVWPNGMVHMVPKKMVLTTFNLGDRATESEEGVSTAPSSAAAYSLTATSTAPPSVLVSGTTASLRASEISLGPSPSGGSAGAGPVDVHGEEQGTPVSDAESAAAGVRAVPAVRQQLSWRSGSLPPRHQPEGPPSWGLDTGEEPARSSPTFPTAY